MWRCKSSTKMTSLDTRGCGGVYKTDTSSKSTCSCVPGPDDLDAVASVSNSGDCGGLVGAVGDCSILEGEFGDSMVGGGVGDEGVKKSSRRGSQSDPMK
jgi:hypothetical protein